MPSHFGTGVVYFRNTLGSLAMVQQWRKAMLQQKGRKDLTENVNDQSLFNQVVSGSELREEGLEEWRTQLQREGRVAVPVAVSGRDPHTRRAFRR
jgi:arabinosyltransferase